MIMVKIRTIRTRSRPPRRAKASREIQRILNCLPSRNVENDWGTDSAEAAGILPGLGAVIPTAKDLRTSWWKIGNQGATGSCVGWACADSVLRWHFVKAGRLSSSRLLSPRYVWMASKETDQFQTRPTTFIELDGTSLKAALDIARKFGVVEDPVLPFTPPRLYGGTANAFYALASTRKISSYFNLGRNALVWKTWLALRGPILTRLNVDQSWHAATQNGGRLDFYQAATAGGGHAVALVGYTADRFIVRNSWGTGWGDGGFGYASLAYAQTAFTEAYGVVV
jgi:hypothetical protein